MSEKPDEEMIAIPRATLITLLTNIKVLKGVSVADATVAAEREVQEYQLQHKRDVK
jgi:hypothetical protein